MNRLRLYTLLALVATPLAAQETEAPALPDEGAEIVLTLKAGPIGGAERFEVVPLDTEAIDAYGWAVFPGAVGLLPVDAPPPEGAVTMLAASSAEAVRDWYLADSPGVVDMTTEMMVQLEAVFVAMAEQEGQQADPDEIETLMGAVEAFFLGNPENGSMVHIFGAEEGELTVITATPPMDDAPAGPVEDPTVGKIPYDPEGPFVCMETSQGKIYIEFFDDLTPVTSANFLKLVDADYYDGLLFHRVIDGFMIQGGDNNAGGPGWSIDLELSAVKHSRGTLSMARTADPNSASAQFFIMHRVSPHLDGGYAAFGRVVCGLEVVDAIVEFAGGKELPPADACESIVGVERVEWADVAAAIEAAETAQ